MVDIITSRPSPRPAVPQQGDSLGSMFTLLAKQYLDPNAAYRAELTTAARNKNQLALEAERALSGGLDNIDYNALGLGAALGAVAPKQLGSLLLVRNANTFGAKDPRTTNAAVGTGQDYGSTYAGASDKLANARTLKAMEEATKTRLASMTPTNVIGDDGMPTIVRQDQAYGRRPSVAKTEIEGALLADNFGRLDELNPPQQKALGALPNADKALNWATRNPDGTVASGRTLDGGKTDASTGQPLPPNAMLVSPLNAGGANSMLQPAGNLSPSMRDYLVSARDANSKMVDLASRMHDMASKDPSIIGAPGNVQRGLQDAFDVGTGIATMFGSRENFQKEFADARENLLHVPGIQNVPGLDLNPNASNIVKLNVLLRYYAAAALAGQSGRALSDKDVVQASVMIGDPSSWLQGSTRYITGLEAIINEANNNLTTIDQQLDANNVRARTGASPQPGAAPTTRIRVDAQGNLIQ